MIGKKNYFEIKILLHYFWDSPALGVRFRYRGRVFARVFRIPEWLAYALTSEACKLERRIK